MTLFDRPGNDQHPPTPRVKPNVSEFDGGAGDTEIV
jgi:hypothetical protein